MKIVLWHGYLLGGTGSNVYTRSLARAFGNLGHEVVVICQDPTPEDDDLGARVVRPDIGPVLPVFVLDHYAGVEARLLGDLTVAERARVVDANAAALRAELPADLVLVNHVLLGAAVGAASGAPYVVKAHGSELEFAMRATPDCARGPESACFRRGRSSPALTTSCRCCKRCSAQARTSTTSLPCRPASTWMRCALGRAPRRWLRWWPSRGATPPIHRTSTTHASRTTGTPSGWPPSSRAKHPRFSTSASSAVRRAYTSCSRLCGAWTRAVIVGFGPERQALERAAEGHVLFTGALEHRHFAHLWPLADVSVTPPVFPEAFGMVAAEAAACGSLPLVARHSGLAGLAAGLADEYPAARRDLVAFAPGDAGDLAVKLGKVARPVSGRARGARARGEASGCPPVELGGDRGPPAGGRSARCVA